MSAFSIAFDQLVTKKYIQKTILFFLQCCRGGDFKSRLCQKTAISMCYITVIVFTLIILDRYHRQCFLIELPVITQTFSGVKKVWLD